MEASWIAEQIDNRVVTGNRCGSVKNGVPKVPPQQATVLPPIAGQPLGHKIGEGRTVAYQRLPVPPGDGLLNRK